MSTLEKRVEACCGTILQFVPEFWEDRNRAMLELTVAVGEYEGAGVAEVQEVFTTQLFRTMREPIRSMVSDLRSLQIRDTCLFLIKLSLVCRDHVRLFLREVFPALLVALKVPNKVMSAYVDDCIRQMIGNANFRVCLPMLVADIRESKVSVFDMSPLRPYPIGIPVYKHTLTRSLTYLLTYSPTLYLALQGQVCS